MHVTAIIAAAGEGRRLGAAVPKQLIEIDGQSILQRSVSAFTGHERVTDVIVTLPAQLVAAPPRWLTTAQAPSVPRLIAGGPRRQDSVANAFAAVAPQTEIVLVHDAARPFVSRDLISRTIDAAAVHGAAIAALSVRDTVKRVEAAHGQTKIVGTLPREAIYLAQTPQAFRRDVLASAIAAGRAGADATDEAMLAEQAGHPVYVVEGDVSNVKITTAEDLARAEQQVRTAGRLRIGTGYDLHRLVDGRPLIIGGVTIPSDKGAAGHSDADVACHAVIDAVLGAACLGNVGLHFPDSDPRWRGASSIPMLREAMQMLAAGGFSIENVDVTIVLERPKIAPFVDAIRAKLAEAVGVGGERVSVKGKTNEGVDAVGRGEAIAAHAVALLSTVRTPLDGAPAC